MANNICNKTVLLLPRIWLSCFFLRPMPYGPVGQRSLLDLALVRAAARDTCECKGNLKPLTRDDVRIRCNDFPPQILFFPCRLQHNHWSTKRKPRPKFKEAAGIKRIPDLMLSGGPNNKRRPGTGHDLRSCFPTESKSKQQATKLHNRQGQLPVRE